MKMLHDIIQYEVIPILPDNLIDEWGEEFIKENHSECYSFLRFIMMKMSKIKHDIEYI